MTDDEYFYLTQENAELVPPSAHLLDLDARFVAAVHEIRDERPDLDPESSEADSELVARLVDERNPGLRDEWSREHFTYAIAVEAVRGGASIAPDGRIVPSANST